MRAFCLLELGPGPRRFFARGFGPQDEPEACAVFVEAQDSPAAVFRPARGLFARSAPPRGEKSGPGLFGQERRLFGQQNAARAVARLRERIEANYGV